MRNSWDAINNIVSGSSAKCKIQNGGLNQRAMYNRNVKLRKIMFQYLYVLRPWVWNRTAQKLAPSAPILLVANISAPSGPGNVEAKNGILESRLPGIGPRPIAARGQRGGGGQLLLALLVPLEKPSFEEVFTIRNGTCALRNALRKQTSGFHFFKSGV